MHRRQLLVLPLVLALPLAAAAQSVDTLTADDYARAERFLAQNTWSLVDGIPGRATWRADGRAWYRVSRQGGSEFVMIDPAAGTRAPAFDHARLAAALGEATGRDVDGKNLPFRDFELSDEGSILTVTVPAEPGRATLACDLESYRCEAADSGGAADGATAHEPPASSVVSPDGSTAVFIRDHDLWARDLRTGDDTQLTTDGVEDYGYGTNNAGWTRRETPVVTWSPDSRRVATFRHDGRGVSRMHLVRTKVGEPELDSWRYPLPGDSVIFRIERLVIDVNGPDAPRVVPLDMPPDAHRSMVNDHVACGTGMCDLIWFPDGSSVAFVSSSRDHKLSLIHI